MNIAVIFAGGVGSRMHAKDKPKQFLRLHGVPILVHTVRAFEEHPLIDAIVISCIEEWIPHCEETVASYGLTKVKAIVPGGTTGQDSIFNGLKAAKGVSGAEPAVALVHDGVRPLIDENLITANINSVRKWGSAITCAKATETVLMVNQEDRVEDIPKRADVRIAKAPQSFWLDDMLEAHEHAIAQGRHDYIDSASLMRDCGHSLHMIEGSELNIKITTQSDYFAMRAILDAAENDQLYGVDDES